MDRPSSRATLFPRLALSCLALVAGAQGSMAQQSRAPYIFSYGGQVLSTSGEPVKGPIDIELRFYRQASGGDAVGISKVFKSQVPLSADGVFQLDVENLLEAEMNLLFDASKATWVEVIANNRTYPRQKLIAVPFALKVPVDGKTVQFNDNGRLTVGPNTTPTYGQFLTRDASGAWIWDTPANGGSGGSTLPSSGSGFLRRDTGGTLTWDSSISSTSMQKSVYDTDNNAVVDNTDKLGGQAASYYRDAANINAGILPLARGGTGATDAATARTSLGLGPLATVTSVTPAMIMNNAVGPEHLNTSTTPTAGSVLTYNDPTMSWNTPPMNAAGNSREIQFNSSSILGTDPSFTWDNTTKTLQAGSSLQFGGMSSATINTLSTDLLLQSSGTTKVVMKSSTGRVGIGSMTPQAMLDVNGAVKIGNDATTCSPSITGAQRYNIDKLQVCDGNVWATINPGPKHFAYSINASSGCAIRAEAGIDVNGDNTSNPTCKATFVTPLASIPICTCSVENISGMNSFCSVKEATTNYVTTIAYNYSGTTTTAWHNVVCVVP